MNAAARIIWVFLFFLMACGTGNPVAGRYTYEDKTVFELIEKLRKNPGDKESLNRLPDAYQAARDKRKYIIDQLKEVTAPGDKYVEIARELTVLQQMYTGISAIPAARDAVPNLWDPSVSINRAYQLAAEDYYDAGMTFLGYNTREYAQLAYDNFSKAAKASPGFRDVDQMLRIAADKAILKVLVNPVDYNRFSWSYWGFQNDFLQQQMVRDLNNRSFRNVRFFTDWELRAQQGIPDKIVDLNFTELFIDQVHSDRNTYRRSKQVQTGQTKSNPARPVYTTVYATVTISRRYMSSFATLECRIYDRYNNQNLLYDRFPDRFNWKQEYATYTGDRRALTNEDLALISNSYNDQPPTRAMIADRLVRNCYQLLISRIQSGVGF